MYDYCDFEEFGRVCPKNHLPTNGTLSTLSETQQVDLQKCLSGHQKNLWKLLVEENSSYWLIGPDIGL